MKNENNDGFRLNASGREQSRLKDIFMCLHLNWRLLSKAGPRRHNLWIWC